MWPRSLMFAALTRRSSAQVEQFETPQMFRKENHDKEVLQTVWERSDQSRGEVLHDLWRDRGRRGDRRRNVSRDRRLTRRTNRSNCPHHQNTSNIKAAFTLQHGRNAE